MGKGEETANPKGGKDVGMYSLCCPRGGEFVDRGKDLYGVQDATDGWHGPLLVATADTLNLRLGFVGLPFAAQYF